MQRGADWDGQTALVTGAAGGIGRAVVAGLLAEGAAVVAFDASATLLAEAQAAWGGGERVRGVTGDVSVTDDVAGAFATAEALGRPLGGVVAAAGIYATTPIHEMTDEQWDRLLAINLRGVFLTCRAAARAMIPRRAGSIVSMSSGIGFSGAPGRAHYAASKAGVAGLTRALALDLGPYGVRANALAPGSIDTPMPRSLPGRSEDAVQATLHDNPLGRVGTPQDIADLILFLLGPRSAHITGQVIHINGGSLMA